MKSVLVAVLLCCVIVSSGASSPADDDPWNGSPSLAVEPDQETSYSNLDERNEAVLDERRNELEESAERNVESSDEWKRMMESYGDDDEKGVEDVQTEKRSSDSESETRKLKSLVSELHNTVASMSQQIDSLVRQDAATRQMVISKTKSGAIKARAQSSSLSKKGITFKTVLTTGGTHYVRWGRRDCPGGVPVLYRGYMAGTRYSYNYGGSNLLCLHDSPQWGTTSQSGGPGIYGTEYYFSSTPFSTKRNSGQTLQYQDAPCAVCQTPLRSSQIMIPGRRQCPTGWTFEYTGYIVTNDQRAYSRTDFICLDAAPGAKTHGISNEGGVWLQPARAYCGSLACPPYVSGRHISCVVCTK